MTKPRKPSRSWVEETFNDNPKNHPTSRFPVGIRHDIIPLLVLYEEEYRKAFLRSSESF